MTGCPVTSCITNGAATNARATFTWNTTTRELWFDPDGTGAAAATRFVDSVKLASHLANVGDAKSLVIHPASTTHFRMDAAALAAAGIGEATLRLSIGLEDADDLIDDLKRGFRAAAKG